MMAKAFPPPSGITASSPFPSPNTGNPIRSLSLGAFHFNYDYIPPPHTPQILCHRHHHRRVNRGSILLTGVRERPMLLSVCSRFKKNRTSLSLSPSSSSPPGASSSLIVCFSQRQTTEQLEQEELEFERLFSNLNRATLKREPGSVSSAVFLVTGTTIGSLSLHPSWLVQWILAIPAVTQESGFLGSAIHCIFCWVFMVGGCSLLKLM
ncbi:hypothetical protein NMG60_11033543 [Bertholletia excelsa]